MGVPCRATGYVRRPPGCPPSSHGARCKPRAAWATCATPCATTAARPRSHGHQRCSRRLTAGAEKPRRRAARPSSARAATATSRASGETTSTRRRGRADDYPSSWSRTRRRRWPARSKVITMAAVAGMHRAVHGRRAARVQRAAHGAQGGHAARRRARRGPGWPRASCRKDRRRSSRRSACFWSPSALFCVAARAAVRAPWCFQGASGAQTRARAAAGPCAARAARARGRRGYFTARRARFLRRARRPVRHENEMRNESCGLRDLRARARPAACLLLLRCAQDETRRAGQAPK